MRIPRSSNSNKRRVPSKEPKFQHRPVSDIEKLGLETESRQCELSTSLINSVLSFDLVSLEKGRWSHTSKSKSSTMPRDPSNKTAKTDKAPSNNLDEQSFASIMNTLNRVVFTAPSQVKHQELGNSRVVMPKKSKLGSKKHEKRKWRRNPIPATITPPTPSPDPVSRDIAKTSKPPLPPINQWDQTRPQLRRGDIQSLIRLKPLLGHQSRYPEVSSLEKVYTLRICLLLKKQYLNQPLTESYTEHAFWTEVHRLLDCEPHPLLQAKFPMVQTLKQNVSFWCEERRNLLARGELSPVGADRQELEVVIDEWNEVWAKRYSKIYKAAFVIEAWPTVQNNVESLIQTTLYDLFDRALEEFKTSDPSHLENGDSDQGKSRKKVEHGQHLAKTQGPGGRLQIRESEGKMSFVLDLPHGLGEAIGKYMQQRSGGASEQYGRHSTLAQRHVASGDANMTVMPSIESHALAASSRVSRWQQDDWQQQSKTLGVMGDIRGSGLPCDSVSSPLGTKRKQRHDDDDDEGPDSPKQRRADRRADSVDSTTSTWSFPSIEELDIRRILDSPEKVRARKPACKPTKISLPIRSERREDQPVGQSIRPAKEGKVGSTRNDHRSSFAVGVKWFTTVQSGVSSPETWDSGPRDRAGQDRAIKAARAVRTGEYGSSSAGRGENQPITPHSRRFSEANDGDGNGRGSEEDANKPQWFRESTPEFRAMPLADRLDMLHRAIKECGFTPPK